MKNFFFSCFMLLCVACCAVKQVTPSEHSRVEVHTETIIQKDTVYLELPVIVEKVQTLDTLSVLENKYAKSEALISGGVLAHSLATKPVSEPVVVDKQTVYRDSLVFVDKVITNTVEVAKPISAGNYFFMQLGKWAFLVLIGYGFWRLFKFLYLPIKK